jgi:hypothetical protein
MQLYKVSVFKYRQFSETFRPVQSHRPIPRCGKSGKNSHIAIENELTYVAEISD